MYFRYFKLIHGEPCCLCKNCNIWGISSCRVDILYLRHCAPGWGNPTHVPDSRQIFLQSKLSRIQWIMFNTVSKTWVRAHEGVCEIFGLRCNPQALCPKPVPDSRHIFFTQNLKEFIEFWVNPYNKQYSLFNMSQTRVGNLIGLRLDPQVLFPTPVSDPQTQFFAIKTFKNSLNVDQILLTSNTVP